MEYPESGDVLGWCAWYLDKNASNRTNMIETVLMIFESDMWCQRSRLRSLRIRAAKDKSAIPELKEAIKRLERTLEFLTLDTTAHRGAFRQYREKLRRGRVQFELFHQIIPDYSYDEIEMELVRCSKI